jgi:altronate dehydratase
VITGYRRASGALGARNHLLVLPSVICSTVVARTIAGDDAVAISHQHGCAEVGDDVVHTDDVFSALGVHANVGGALVVGLGCETVQGGQIAERIERQGGQVAFVGIQTTGSTSAAVLRGRELLAILRSEAERTTRSQGALDEVVLGLDSRSAPFAGSLNAIVQREGARVVLPEVDMPPGASCHPDLARAGAQVIVSWCGPGEAAVGFAICPVVAVAGDAALYEAMPDEFDLVGAGRTDDDVAQSVWATAIEVFKGREVAAERRGASDFLLRRVARSM